MVTHEENNGVILRMQGVNKSFGGIYALRNVNFELNAREIHGLLGGNGAGKTTLMNILYGLYRQDSGQLFLHGKRLTIRSPKDAIANRIGMVHQHFLQVANFSVLENITLGYFNGSRFSGDYSNEEEQIRSLAERFGLQIDLNTRINELTIGARQKVEILKALFRGVEILILDEPTTNLTPQEVDALFRSLREMVNQGMSIVFITHKLPETLNACDRITVLRNGNNVMAARIGEASEEAIIRAMVGPEMNFQESVIFSRHRGSQREISMDQTPTLALESIQSMREGNVHVLKNIHLEVFPGEIFGIAGVAGNGQTELAETIMQIRPPDQGVVQVCGQVVNQTPVKHLFEMGVSYIPEDRLQDGFLLRASVAQNLVLGWHDRAPYAKNGFINWRRVNQSAEKTIDEFRIKTSGPDEFGGNLSGGNIQRVMIARAMKHLHTLLVAHNPTRGLDIPSMDFFYSLLLKQKAQGISTLLLSENLDELLLLCDRIAVLYRGEIMGVLPRESFEKYEIGRMMSGG